ncbi:MAG: hypothetical protein IAG13_35890 [Deltaproteobacteria bacterium]|nr:hypothetical protein [Nannocystaceae bacterium]
MLASHTAAACGDEPSDGGGASLTGSSPTVSVTANASESGEAGGDEAEEGDSGQTNADSLESGGSTDTDPTDGGTDDGTTGADPFDPGLCGEAPPDGAPTPPAPPAYSGGVCPMLQAGYNTGFIAGGLAREFALILPSDVDDTGTYPLMFAWYHISGNAMDFVDEVGAQALADTARAIIVIPQDTGMFEAKWPTTPLDIGSSGVDLAMFDDLYACISQQFAVNQQCVATIGVSAGGLWTSYLGSVRGQYFASDITISGGHPSEIVGPWWPWNSPRRFAGLVMWGGPTDKLGIDFHAASLNLVGDYTGSGHFTLRCEHTGGHGLPPPGDGDPLLTALHFVRNHPYWLDGESPLDMGLPSFYPSFCMSL